VLFAGGHQLQNWCFCVFEEAIEVGFITDRDRVSFLILVAKLIEAIHFQLEAGGKVSQQLRVGELRELEGLAFRPAWAVEPDFEQFSP